jgi:hypothetical protein
MTDVRQRRPDLGEAGPYIPRCEAWRAEKLPVARRSRRKKTVEPAPEKLSSLHDR